jgi:hypothetical protein
VIPADELEDEQRIFDRASYLTVRGDFMPETRKCCECAASFVPRSDKQIRCAPCQVDDDGIDL